MVHEGPKPSNMNEICRLCLADDGNTSPIFGDDDSDHAEIPLSFRIMACVSVEVSLTDGLPTLICQRCLDQVNSWHEFKEACDTAQEKLKVWQDSAKDVEKEVETGGGGEQEEAAAVEKEVDRGEEEVVERGGGGEEEVTEKDKEPVCSVSPAPTPSPVASPIAEPNVGGIEAENEAEKNMAPQEIIIKQEPVEPVEEEVEEIFDSTHSENENYMMDYIKQEEIEVEDPREPEVMCEETGDPLSLTLISATSLLPREDLDEHAEASCISELRISNIKTECEDIIDIDDDDDGEEEPVVADGHLLRSVLQGKAKMAMYSRKVPMELDSGLPAFGVKPFTCNICNKSFSYNYLLKRHEKIHKAERNMCVYCHKSFSCHTDLLTHVNHYVAGLPKQYTCEHCQQAFPCRSSYAMHDNCPAIGGNRRVHSGMREAGENKFQCYLCLGTFASQVLLRFHMRKDHQHYSCHKCNKLFSNGVALSNHLRGHCTGSGKKKCDMCPKSFSTMSLLMRHKRSHFRASAAVAAVPKVAVPKKTVVENLPEESLVKKEPMTPPQEVDDAAIEELAGKEESERLESRDGPHACSVCDETFSSQAALRFHLKGIHMQYHCHRCPKVYTSGVALSNHLRSHNLQGGMKRHRCLTCLKTFHNLDLLAKHKKVHGSPSMETRQTRMQEALAQASPAGDTSQSASVADRTCSVCNLISASRSALERHMACHMKEKMYTCHVCQLSMGYASSLQKHLRGAHGIVVELKSIQKDNEVADGGEVVDEELKTDTGEDSQNVNEETGEVIEVDEQDQGPPTKEGESAKEMKVEADVQPVDNSGLPFECKTCNSRFQYRSVLLRHLKVHKLNCGKNVPVSCPICMKTFSDSKTLNNHKGVHTRFKHYPCHTCGKSFNGLNAWQKHQRMHQKGFIYSCKLCGKKFISKADLHEHKKMHIKLKIYTCGVCKNSYHSSSALSKHKRKNGHYATTVEAEIDIDNPELELSDDAFSDVEMIAGDMMPGEEPLEQPLQEQPLQQQQQEQLSQEPLSYVEGFYPSGRRRPTCTICHRVFTRYSALKRHRRLHMRNYMRTMSASTTAENKEGEVPEESENRCPICNRTFSDHASLIRHKGWHTRRSGLGLPPIPPLPSPVATPAPGDTAVQNDVDVVDEPKASATSPVKTESTSPSKVASLCPHCHKTFATPAALANHIKVHENNPKTFTCSKCHKSFSTNSALANHVKIHIFYCAKCERNFSTGSALANHLRSHAEKAVTSDVPKDSSKDSQDLEQSPQRRLACKICRKPFESKKALITHIGWHSRTSHSKKLMINQWKPNISITPVVNTATFLPTQVENEKVEESFECNVCHKAFSSSMALNKHRKLHTRHLLSSIKVKPDTRTVSLIGSSVYGRFPCHVCSRVFKMKRYLDIHMEVHSTERRFKCNQCPQAYHSSGSLWKHKRTQHAFKLFSCPVCQMRFGIKSQLMQHMRSHDISEEFLNTNQNVYSCGLCSKAFGRLDRLKQHERTHQV